MSKAKPPGKKAPGFFSFVVWRQFFMVLAAPGMATVAVHQVPDTNFIVALIVSAAPSLLHGQFWKWSYDWAGYGEPTVNRVRQGQVLAGLAHIGLVGWALFYVGTGEVPFDGTGFYFGLTIAGGLAGVWETIRPILELTGKEPPPAKTVVPPPERQAEPAASTRISPEEAEPGPPQDPTADPAEDQPDASGITIDDPDLPGPSESAEDPSTAPTAGS